MNGCIALWRIWDLLLERLVWSASKAQFRNKVLTSFSKTHLFNLRSSDLQFQSCWLWFSRHCQWVRNWSRHSLLMSAMLEIVSALPWVVESTHSYTLAAHLVTLRPSFMHSSSPRPLASVLHIM